MADLSLTGGREENHKLGFVGLRSTSDEMKEKCRVDLFWREITEQLWHIEYL